MIGLFFFSKENEKKDGKNKNSTVVNNHFSAWKVNEVLLTNEVEL